MKKERRRNYIHKDLPNELDWMNESFDEGGWGGSRQAGRVSKIRIRKVKLNLRKLNQSFIKISYSVFFLYNHLMRIECRELRMNVYICFNLHFEKRGKRRMMEKKIFEMNE